MIPAPFDYHRPGTLDEAIGLLARYGEEAKVLSGGMSLLPAMKLRLGSYAHLVDISRIPGLEYVKEEKGVLRIGAGTRQATLERSELIKAGYPLLADALPLIADPLVRNRGTIGGNLANGDPANDHPAIAIALGAELVARGPKGERSIPANRFYKSLFTTELKADEILVEIRVPVPPARSGGAYRKLKRKTGDFAAAAVAVQLSLSENGTVDACRHRADECGADADRGGRGAEVSLWKSSRRKKYPGNRKACCQGRRAERRPARLGGIQARDGARDGGACPESGARARGEGLR